MGGASVKAGQSVMSGVLLDELLVHDGPSPRAYGLTVRIVVNDGKGMGLSRRDIRDLLRGVGGLLLAIGAVALWARKSTHEEWGGLARLLVVAVPAVLLFVLALDLSAPRSREKAYPWQSVLMVTSILLGPVVLFQFLDWIGVSTGHVLLEAAVFALIALVAAYAALRARVSYAALLAGLSALLAWLLVWDKILDHPSANTYRWLLVAAAALLFFISRRLFRADSIGAPEVATAGGVSAVAAGVFGVVVGAVVGVYGAATRALESSSGGRPFLAAAGGRTVFGHVNSSGFQHFFWDLYLLVVSLALVWVGSRVRFRGLGYVGGVGVLAFLVSIVAQITRIEGGRSPTASVLGWPLALLLLGAAALVASTYFLRDAQAPSLASPRPPTGEV
ncbi:MAG: hypothetical protein WAU69_12980 [Solirubrobacteraceae bacterium]